jgi:hypothetical protein
MFLRKTSTASRNIFNILVFVRGTEHVFCKPGTNISNILLFAYFEIYVKPTTFYDVLCIATF